MQKIINSLLRRICFCLLMGLLFVSCKGQEQRLQCYNKELGLLQEQPVYHTVRNALRDTLAAWMDRDLKGVKRLKEEEWKIDEAVFFNDSQNKAILLVLKRDTAQLVNFGDTMEPPSLDYIKLYFANLEEGKWAIYSHSMQSFTVIRERYGKTTPMTFEELSKIGRTELLNGFYRPNTCTHNKSFIESWNINFLKELHKRFLDNDSTLFGW